MKIASRLEGIGEYYFSQKLSEIEKLNKAGKAIINLGIGSPDLPPHKDVIETLQSAAALPNTHAYQSYRGSPVLRQAISQWYKTWYQVTINPDTEILPLIGSKEGLMHICMTYLNPGDKALVPNPGYPTYTSAVKLAGGIPTTYLLNPKKNYEPDFEALEKLDLAEVKLMFINYPHMPTGKTNNFSLYERLVNFAQKHQILLVHDNPYSFILNPDPQSIFQVGGAKTIALELSSLSKSHNMAGWRVGAVCGAAERINEILRFRSNMDSGMFLPIQLAAAKALSLGQDWYDSVNKTYAARRNYVFQLFDQLNCHYDKNQVGLFVWAKIPKAYPDGYALSDKVLYEAQVFITPGGIFGSEGNNFVRISLCSKIEDYKTAIQRVSTLI